MAVDTPARQLYEMRQGSWRDAIHSVDAEGDPIDTSPLNYKEAINIAAVAASRAHAAISAIEKSSSLKSQVAELRRYASVSRTVVGVVCVSLMLLGEDIDHLLSDGGNLNESYRFVPKHPQKLQMCWTHVKKKIIKVRRGPGIQNAPFTTRLLRWKAEEYFAVGLCRLNQVDP